MSRQQTRSSGDGAIDPSLVQKKRARHRLVGAICLCLLAAIVVPLVLESEPRPRDRNLPIELATPSRNADERPAPGPAADTAGDAAGRAHDEGGAAASGRGPGTGTVASGAIGNLGSSSPAGGPLASGRPDRPGAAPSGPRADAAVQPAPSSQSSVKTITPPAGPGAGTLPGIARQEPRPADVDAARAEAAKQNAAKQEAARQDAAKSAAAKGEARNDGGAGVAKPPLAQDKVPGRNDEPDVLARLIDRTNVAGSGAAPGAGAGKTVSRKFLVQIGAYSNVQSARSVSDRAVQVGLRPYQETVKTAQGDWIRVRVGPFATRQDAERAQQDLKRAGVTAAIIAL